MPDISSERIHEALSGNGFMELHDLFDPQPAKELLDAALATRRFDESLFLSEEEWEASPKSHRHTNPGPGYNVLERFPEKLDFVEKNTALISTLTRLLGPDYVVYNKKLVCRLAWNVIPEWLRQKTFGATNTYGAYIKQPYRDISYFLDVDLHQDIQDRIRRPVEGREHRYITLYIYLDDVTEADAPLYLLPGSHVLGATPFQHDIRYLPEEKLWSYSDPAGETIRCPMKKLIGKGGYAGIWHPCLLHGSPPARHGHLRISLRYLIGCNRATRHCELDDINRAVRGPLYLDQDFSPGFHANKDGSWNVRMTDFVRMGYTETNWTHPPD